MDWSGASSGVPSTLVYLSFEATGLRNYWDVMGTSDPMLVAFGINQGGQEEELGRSETIPNTLNPKWVYHLTIPYRFEETQHLRFVVYDVDSNYREKTSDKFKLEKQDYLGEVKSTLAEILASPPHVLTRQLQRGPRSTDLTRPSGTLIIRAEEVAAEFGRPEEVELAQRCANLLYMETFSKSDPFVRISKSAAEFGRPEEVELAQRCANLLYMETLSKSDPFVRISKSAAEGAWTPVYQTEHIQNNRAYSYSWRFSYYKLIGGMKTTINQLQEHCRARTPLILTRQSKISKNVNKSRGNLFVDICKITPVISSFVDSDDKKLTSQTGRVARDTYMKANEVEGIEGIQAAASASLKKRWWVCVILIMIILRLWLGCLRDAAKKVAPNNYGVRCKGNRGSIFAAFVAFACMLQPVTARKVADTDSVAAIDKSWTDNQLAMAIIIVFGIFVTVVIAVTNCWQSCWKETKDQARHIDTMKKPYGYSDEYNCILGFRKTRQGPPI